MEMGSGRMNGAGANSHVAASHSNRRQVITSQAGGRRSQPLRLSFLMLEHTLTFEDLPHVAAVFGELWKFADRQRARPREVDL